MNTLSTKEKMIKIFKNDKQDNTDNNYKQLIEVSVIMYKESLSTNNLILFILTIMSLYVFIEWYKYQWWNIKDTKYWEINPFEILFNNINHDWSQLTQEWLVFELKNFILDLMTSDDRDQHMNVLHNIIKNYNITLKTWL